MGKNLIIAGALICLFLGQKTLGQVQVKITAMKQGLIFRPNQDAIRGKIAEIREECIVVLSSEREVTVPFADISRIILTYEQGSGRGTIYGAVLAGYASTYVLVTSQDHGGFVRSRDLPIYLIGVVPSIALGVGIGYLVDPGSAQKEEVFDFTGTDEAKGQEKSHLVRAATHGSSERKVHISFQGSHVNASYDNSAISGFNMLRKAQMTYSAAPEIEVGIALVWFGEPPQSADAFEILTNGDFKFSYVSQTLEASGKYIVGSYKPLYHLVDSWLNLKVGGGLGIAPIDYNRSTTISGITPQYSSFNIADNSLSAYFFGQLDFELVEGLSVGLIADKVFGPSRDAPAVPKANIPTQTISFGNTSVGFTVSFHF
jgi:hypothetical protein